MGNAAGADDCTGDVNKRRASGKREETRRGNHHARRHQRPTQRYDSFATRGGQDRASGETLLKREMRNAQSTAKQLREDNRLKSDAIALARGDKARLSESLSYEKKLKKVARKEEERVASLYAEAAQCLQSEHSHLQGLNKQLLQLHWAVAKVFAGLEGWVKRMSGDDHGEIQRGAIGGCSGSDPGNAPGTLPSHIKERSDIVSWDRKMLDQVYRWLQLKMAHDDKQGQHFAVSSRNPTPVSSVSSRSPSRASPSRLPWQTTASLANTPQSPYALPRVVTPQRPKPMFYDTDVIL